MSLNAGHKKIVARNKKSCINYFIEETFEAGIVLKGSEVKSLRSSGGANIEDCYSQEVNNELFLLNCYIPEYTKSNRFNHVPRRPRKLLFHKQQIKRILGKIKQKGYAFIALSLYFNSKNIAKVALGLGKGKKLHDKRQDIKNKDWKRQQQRALKSRV